MKNKCLICGSNTNPLFTSKILFKYDICYHKCPSCGFVQTDSPFWLDEAYQSPIVGGDIGLIQRNINCCISLNNIIKSSFDYNGKFLDYAGGYGILVRMMRDKGFDFYWDDKYCENLFSQYFTLERLDPNTKFEAVTGFEVFEHLPDPLSEISKLFEYSDTIIFSTELVPDREIKSEKDWWYINNSGQHISFYTRKSFEVIAEKFACNFYTNGHDLHILTKKKLEKNPLVGELTFWDKIANRLTGILQKSKSDKTSEMHLPSKLPSDSQYISGILNNKQLESL